MKRRNRQVYRQQEAALEQAVELMTAAIAELTEREREINRLRAALNLVETAANVVLDGGRVEDLPFDADDDPLYLDETGTYVR